MGGGGGIVLSARSEAEARGLAQALPFAPYAEMQITLAEGLERAGRPTAR
jgi:hypothetical protein